MANRPAQAELYLVPHDQLDHVLGMAGADRHLDPGVLGDEAFEQLRQDVGAHRGGCRDHEVARGGSHHLFQRVPPVDQSPQRTLREGNPGAPGVGEAHAVGRAQEERGAELPLQSVEARRQGRLGDEERFRGPADAAPAGHFEEALDLHQLNSTGLAVT